MRIDIRAILRNPVLKKELMVSTIIATQAREGITTTQEQAEAAYDVVKKEPKHFDQQDKSCFDYGCTDDCPVGGKKS